MDFDTYNELNSGDKRAILESIFADNTDLLFNEDRGEDYDYAQDIIDASYLHFGHLRPDIQNEILSGGYDSVITESKASEYDEEENYDQRDESELEGGSYDDGASSNPDNWYRTEDGQWKVVGDEPYEGESKTSEEVESKEELEQRISELQNYLEHAVTQEIPVMPKMRKMLSLIEKMRKINPDYNNQWWNYYGIE